LTSLRIGYHADSDAIAGNEALTDVTALYGVTHVSNGVFIIGNITLTDAAAEALVDEIDVVDGPVSIHGND
jgi:hypothetical protein